MRGEKITGAKKKKILQGEVATNLGGITQDKAPHLPLRPVGRFWLDTEQYPTGKIKPTALEKHT